MYVMFTSISILLPNDNLVESEKRTILKQMCASCVKFGYQAVAWLSGHGNSFISHFRKYTPLHEDLPKAVDTRLSLYFVTPAESEAPP